MSLLTLLLEKYFVFKMFNIINTTMDAYLLNLLILFINFEFSCYKFFLTFYMKLIMDYVSLIYLIFLPLQYLRIICDTC